jgi:tRNA nucleotidyltransferase (CCA-adding enzyme)
MSGYWEHFAHEADIGIRGVGATREEAFEQAAVAMIAVVVDPDTVRPMERVDIECDGTDDELLLAEWLNKIIYEMSSRRMLFSRFSVHLQGLRLHGSAWGEPVDRERHQPAVEVKGATYTALGVACEGGKWLAQTVIDV